MSHIIAAEITTRTTRDAYQGWLKVFMSHQPSIITYRGERYGYHLANPDARVVEAWSLDRGRLQMNGWCPAGTLIPMEDIR